MTTPLPHPIPKEAASPVKPELSHLQIHSLAQLWHDEPDLALELATLEGKKHDRSSNKS